MVAETNKRCRSGLAAGFILIVLVAMSPAEEMFGRALQNETSAERQNSAKHFKELGDQYVSQEKLADAAAAYERALSLARYQFTMDERVRMAVYISWDNRLDTAIDELQRVLREDSKHIAARIHLARVYSWTGALAQSVGEADQVLRMSPANQEALLVKADALEWQGKFGRAIPIYKEVLRQDDRFEARLGLSYALLSAGNQAGASQTARNLAAESDRQKRQLNELREAIDSATRPRFDIRYNQYQDSDHNHGDRYSLVYALGLGNQTVELNVTREDTRSLAGNTRSDGASLNMYSTVTDGLKLGGGVGVARLGTENRSNFLTGQFRIDAVLSNASFGASVTTEMLTDTVQLVDNRVRATHYSGHVSKPWTQRISTYGAYTYKTFSDGNRAHDVQFAPQYTLNFAPRIAVGYRFRFLDFNEQSGSGFFDPNNYASHRLFSSISVEKRKISTYLDVFAGKQNFVRNAFPSNDWVVGGSAAIALRPIPQLTIEANGEGGNFDAGSVAGFKYFTVGTRVSYRF